MSDWSDTPEGWHKRPFLLIGTTDAELVEALGPLASGLDVPVGWLTDHFDATALNPDRPFGWDDLQARLRAKTLLSWVHQWAVVIAVGRATSKAMGFRVLKWEDFEGTYIGAVPDPRLDWYEANKPECEEYLQSLGVRELVKPGHQCWVPPDEVVWNCAFCGQDWENGVRRASDG